MGILSINSNPGIVGQSKNEFLLAHLVKGKQETSAEREIVNIRQKKVSNPMNQM